MEKIKSIRIETILQWFSALVWLMVFGLLVYTRFVNLNWGLPYPFHPDERNMAVALQHLGCAYPPDAFSEPTFYDCFNPRFFAYGQLPLYAGYALNVLQDMYAGAQVFITFDDAVIALRVLSASSAVATGVFLILILKLLSGRYNSTQAPDTIYSRISGNLKLALVSFLFIFSPVLIQFAHFGTTESLLMLLYVVLVYVSLLFAARSIPAPRYILIAGVLVGLAVSAKVSALVYGLLPFFVLFRYTPGDTFVANTLSRLNAWARFGFIALVTAAIFSPFNILAFSEFLGSMDYESGVAVGRILVFYTRQFFMTVPVLFQIEHIFPYALGWGVFILFVIGFFFLPFGAEERIIRASFLIVFLPNAFMYAKWTRFIAPAYPIMILIAAATLYLVILRLGAFVLRRPGRGRVFLALSVFYACVFWVIVAAVIPGIAYLSVYRSPDVRFQASDWIYTHISPESFILSETANVVDLPIPTPQNTTHQNYRALSFNFYELDADWMLRESLREAEESARYIFVPSRRIFMNHTCYVPTGRSIEEVVSKNPNRCQALKLQHPYLYNYYDRLFSGDAGFVKVAEFTSYPKLTIFGRTFEFPDERAEETWTVFDHPVIRIYARTGT